MSELPTRRPVVDGVRRAMVAIRQNRLALLGVTVLAGFVVVVVLTPVLTPYRFDAVAVENRLQAPSPAHPFGTDHFGRDVFTRTLYGARVALIVAVATPVSAAVVGVPIGLLAGTVGGRVDDALMRAMDALFAFPTILLGLTLVAVFGQSLSNIVLAMGVVFVPQFARVTRASAADVVDAEHVRVATAMGASRTRVVLVHVLPFCLSAILVQASITAALAIVVESSLSFLGVGVPPPRPSWGSMLRTGKGYLESAWWFSVFPGLAIVTTVLGFNMLGDGLRDVLDPRTGPER